jgi:hypothetical protein
MTEAKIAEAKIEERYGYYRRCERFRRNGEQCKAPAMKGQALCYMHARQAERRKRQFELGPLEDRKSIQKAINEVMQAIVSDRIDDDYAGELLQEVERAQLALRAAGR